MTYYAKLEEIEFESEQRGKRQEKIENAKSLLDVLDDETISNKLKLPLEEVKALREESIH